MKESDITGEITNMLFRHGIWGRKNPDAMVCSHCHKVNWPVGGRPDISCLNAPIVIEVKAFPANDKATFAFKEITADQRTYLAMFEQFSGETKSFLALGMTHGRANSRQNQRRLWIVPWFAWLPIEDMLLPHRRSLPLAKFKGQKPKIVQENNLNALNLLEPYEMRWESGGWQIPAIHKLSRWTRALFDHQVFKDEWTVLRQEMRNTWGEP